MSKIAELSFTLEKLIQILKASEKLPTEGKKNFLQYAQNEFQKLDREYFRQFFKESEFQSLLELRMYFSEIDKLSVEVSSTISYLERFIGEMNDRSPDLRGVDEIMGSYKDQKIKSSFLQENTTEKKYIWTEMSFLVIILISTIAYFITKYFEESLQSNLVLTIISFVIIAGMVSLFFF